MAKRFRWMLVVLGLSVGALDLATATGAGATLPVGRARANVNAAPVTEVLSPRGPTPASRVVVRGRASDDRAITKVKVTIKDRTTGRYWNPARRRWQAAWLWYDATVVRPRARASEWTFTFDPGGRAGSGRYQATAVAWDDQGTRDPGVARRRFRFEAGGVDPTTRITAPVDGALLDDGAIAVEGTTSDDRAVGTVKVAVRDLDRNRFWNGQVGTWQDTWAWFDADLAAPGARTSAWSYDVAAEAGRYRITATSFDASGREDKVRSRIDVTVAGPPPADGGRTLVWNDEFDGTTLDPTHWKSFSGLYNTPYCFQNYTSRPQNVRVEGGNLVLEAHRESSNGQAYTSGMVVSNDFRDAPATQSNRGNTAWRYGRFEMRARVPDVSGMWPAFWMRPAHGVYGGWPRSGEIDILEYPGPTPSSWNDRRFVHDLHWWSDTARNNNGSVPHNTRVTTAWLDEFHTFAVEWSPAGFRWYVDGQLTHQATGGWSAPGGGPGAPFDQEFFITLNLQVGGWAGQVTDAQLPAQFEIDYVRVYQ